MEVCCSNGKAQFSKISAASLWGLGLLQAQGDLASARPLYEARAGDRREGARLRPFRYGVEPQQPGDRTGARPLYERAGDRREGARPRPSRHGVEPQQSRAPDRAALLCDLGTLLLPRRRGTGVRMPHGRNEAQALGKSWRSLEGQKRPGNRRCSIIRH